MAAAVLAAALAVVGLQAPAGANPAPPVPLAPSYLQPDVPRSLDVGLLPATGDARFARAKVKPALPARDKAGRTFVYVEGTSAAAARTAVQMAGGRVLQTTGKRVRAAVAGADLITLAKQPGVAAVRQPDKAFPLAVTSEGVEASGAGAWIRAGKTGAGVKVGIVDIGFDGLADAQAAGEIPAGATLHGDDCPADNSSSHGTAVAEVVHDMAPGADLYLACAPDSMTFATAVQWLLSQHVQVINAAIGFPNTGRGDGTGPDGSPAAVVKQARQAGVLWVAAAGNQAQLHWSGPAADANGDGYVEVNGAAEGNGVAVTQGGSATVSLRWDAWPTTRQDLDLIVMSANRVPTGPGDPAIVAQSTNPQSTAATPLPPTEQVTIDNTSGGAQTYWIYIATKASYAATRADLFVMGDAQSLGYTVPAGSVLEPATSPYAMAVGASAIGSGRVADYSSQGPTVDGRTKPDITGQSDVSTYTFGPAPSMSGTSAAAAHVTGAAALLLGANGTLDAGQVESLLEGRTSPSKFDNQWGHGLLALGSADDTQPPAGNGFTPLQTPTRVLATTSATGGHQRQFTAGEVFSLPIAGLPGDATAVVVNLSATSAAATDIALYRDVDSLGDVPTLHLNGASEKRTTMAIVPLSDARTIAIRNSASTTDMYLDLVGYFSPTSAGTYFPEATPVRVLDTHTALGGHPTVFAAGETVTLGVRGVAGVPDNATAVLLNVHATEASVASYLQVYPQTQPASTGTLDSMPDSIRSNLALSGIGDDGAVRIHNSAGTTGVAVDLVGWFAAGSGAKYVPLARSAKVLDTRTGTGTTAGQVGQGGIVPLSVDDVAGVPADVTAPVLTLSDAAGAAGTLAVHATERGSSGLTDVDGLLPGKSATGLVIPATGGSGQLKIRAESGDSDLVAGVTGYFTGGPALPEQTGSCALDAEPGFTPIFDGRSPQSTAWRQAGTAGTITRDGCELSSTPNTSYLWYSAENLPSEYTLRMDYKTASDTSDSGVLLGFGAPLDGVVASAGGYEVQIRPNGAATQATGSITSARAPTAQAEKPAGEWNALEIGVSGKRITVTLNGVAVNDYVATAAGRMLDPAFIGLQGSAPGDPVTFRDVRVRAVKPAAHYGAITGNGANCVDVYNGARAAATPLQAIVCKGNEAQQFTTPGDGTLRIYGLCVDANGPVRSAPYLYVQTATCNGSATQQWQARADGTLYSAALNTCLDAPATGVLQLETWSCNGGANQQWRLPTAVARFGPLIENAFAGLCVDVTAQKAASETQLQVVSCKADIGSQQVTMPGDGTIRIYGYCFDVGGPTRTSTSRYMWIYTCNGTASQQFAVRPGDVLYNPLLNECVDGYALTATGNPLETYPCNTGLNQRFSLPALGLGAGSDRSSSAKLVASWSMNENNGTTTADDTTGARTQTLTSGPTWTTGHEGAGLSFNGTNAYATTPTTTVQTDRSFSVSAWAKVTTGSTSRTIVAQDGTNRTPFALLAYPASNEWEFALTASSTATAYTRIGAGNGSLVLNRWTHLVGVYDAEAGQARLYVDGVLKKTLTVPKLWLAPGATVLGRGWWTSAQADFFAGQLDDVQLYQGVLTQDQVTALSRT